MADKAKQKFLREQYKKVAAKSKPGAGARFKSLVKSIAANPKVKNPGAVAYSAGAKKYGSKMMHGWAAAGRRSA
jgi:hypothetical protein